jgi:4-hydroxy-2-oxoheptanedioate aldolase
MENSNNHTNSNNVPVEKPEDIDPIRDKGYLFKKDLKAGIPKFGIFVNSASPVVAEQLSHAGYDWLLVDMQHGPMNYVTLSAMLGAIANGKALSFVRVGGAHDRIGIQQALDLGANGILIPYVNNKEEAEQGISCCLYPTQGTRSVYFPQRCTNLHGLLGYVGNSNKNVVVAVQVETADCIKNIDEIVGLPGLDIAFLGQNDLCMSMGLYEKYVFPEMYFSPELNQATEDLVQTCKKYNKTPGVFLFGTDRVSEFLKKGFPFVSIGNDLHHILTQSTAHIKNLEEISSKEDKAWTQKK